MLADSGLSALIARLSAGALGDLVGVVPLLVVSAAIYCAAGLLALVLLTRPRTGSR